MADPIPLDPTVKPQPAQYPPGSAIPVDPSGNVIPEEEPQPEPAPEPEKEPESAPEEEPEPEKPKPKSHKKKQ